MIELTGLCLFVVGLGLVNIGMAGMRISRNAKRIGDPTSDKNHILYSRHIMMYDPDTNSLSEIRVPNDAYYLELGK